MINKISFGSSIFMIKTENKKNNTELNELIENEVKPLVEQKVLKQNSNALLNIDSIKLNEKASIGGYNFNFKKNSTKKDIVFYAFTRNHDEFSMMGNETTVKKLFGIFYQIKTGLGDKNLLTRDKNKFIEHLSNIITNFIK